MARLLLASGQDAGLEVVDVADVQAGAVGGGVAAALEDVHDADLLLASAQEQLLAERHEKVHAFHNHLNRGVVRHPGHGGAGIIWLLILLHVAFLGYWGWIWWRQRKQREASGRKQQSVPQKVNCVYDWSATPALPLPALQLGAKAAQH
ncbi:hypothetical protein ABPG77_006299 [Micractinium sp. CCAP 211/92]